MIDPLLFGCAAATNPAAVAVQPLFISKWIDYSNKYGFGFQLSDRAVGVLFNDSTRISFSGDRSQLDYQDAGEKMTSHSIGAVPPYLLERLTMLRYFAEVKPSARFRNEPLPPAESGSSASYWVLLDFT